MPGFIEERLKGDLRDLIKTYIDTFPFSYAVFSNAPVDFALELDVYAGTIEDKFISIISAAAAGIQKYCNLFDISPVKGIDEFKTIYFLGRAIEAQLLNVKNVRLAQIHMYTMIGLMDEKLKSKNVQKEELTHAMLSLIDQREFDNEMGKTGCYFTYKCSSTASEHKKIA